MAFWWVLCFVLFCFVFYLYSSKYSDEHSHCSVYKGETSLLTALARICHGCINMQTKNLQREFIKSTDNQNEHEEKNQQEWEWKEEE